MPSFKPLARAAIVLSTVLSALVSQPASASLRCEELMAQRSCADSGPRSYPTPYGASISVAAPIISGFPTACWTWNRQFQCVETDPIYECTPAANPAVVNSTCSLTNSVINATVKINSISYITDAKYTYRCGFSDFTTNDPPLPTDKECVMLDKKVTSQTTVPAAPIGGDPSVAKFTSSVVTDETQQQSYVCYSPPQTTCSDICYESVKDPATGTISQREVACTSPVSNCTQTDSQCEGSVSGGQLDLSLGPDGRCVRSQSTQMCQNGSVPRCLTSENCSLNTTSAAGVQSNGVATKQEQTYVCKNSSTSCKTYATVDNCVSANAWGWDQLSIQGQVGQGLGEFNQALAKLEGIQKGLKQNDPYIFSGKDLRCHYPVGNFLNTFITIAVIAVIVVASGGAGAVFGEAALSSVSVGTGALVDASVTAAASGLTTSALTIGEANTILAGLQVAAAAAADAPNSRAFGSNCCKDYLIQGSESWFKLGACTGDEIRLAVARQKGLHHYLGEYCSKRGGFPVRQCVEKSRTFCVFDDMLALVVNEQGRAQLDAMAMADATSASSSNELSFSLYGPYVSSSSYAKLATGHWVKRVTQAGSQIWTWEYPNYCSSAAAQTAAYNVYEAELNAKVDTKGIQPSKMTQAQAKAMLVGIVGLKPFQDCPDTPGTLPVLTCSRTDDACDTSRLPESPTDVETDVTGSTVTTSDVNWRIQNIRTFFNPGDYGVVNSMVSNSSYAAVSASVSESVTATGSCKSSGACLYRFGVTNKQATGGAGAHKRTTEYAQFPLFTVTPNANWPAVSYVNKDGTFSMSDYRADPNHGVGTPVSVGSQRFIFRPFFARNSSDTATMPTGMMMEWATRAVTVGNITDDYTPLTIPTTIPANSPTWAPYGLASDNSRHFFLSGKCDPNSRWCNYQIDVDLSIPRHPWGSAKEPRCWGFTIEQLTALDFNKMDLSRWINSLDLDSPSANMSTEAATAMGNQVTKSAQSFYSSFKAGSATQNQATSTLALVTSTDVLPDMSAPNFEAYNLKIAVPSNWPAYYDNQPNNNPVSNAKVDWGDGTPMQTLSLASTQRAYTASHDYGDKPVGRYKVTVTLNTSGSGSQTLTSYVSLTSDAGKTKVPTTLDFTSPGADGTTRTYVPSQSVDGTNTAPANLQSLSPGTLQQFNSQGSAVSK